MTPPFNPIAALLLDDVPKTYCYLCLAGKLQVTEEEVRGAVQRLVEMDGFQISPACCADCGWEDDLLQLPGLHPRPGLRRFNSTTHSDAAGPAQHSAHPRRGHGSADHRVPAMTTITVTCHFPGAVCD